MRIVDYVVFGHHDSPAVRGTVADLVRAIPYAIVGGFIPPRSVLNELLQRGTLDTGMSGGCTWDPFQLSEGEFVELVADLTSQPGPRGEEIRFDAPPAAVTTRKDWDAWLANRLGAMPGDDHKRLWQGVERAQEAGRKAAAEGNRLGQVFHLAELFRRLAQYTARAQQPRIERDATTDTKPEQ